MADLVHLLLNRRGAASLILPLLTLAVFALGGGLTDRALAAPAHVTVELVEVHSGDLPLEAGRKGLQDRAALTRGGFVLAAIDSSRRKVRAPQRSPLQALPETIGFLPGAVRRSSISHEFGERPLRCSQPRRPFLSQGPPSREIS